jgi:hypothetical protein
MVSLSLSVVGILSTTILSSSHEDKNAMDGEHAVPAVEPAALEPNPEMQKRKDQKVRDLGQNESHILTGDLDSPVLLTAVEDHPAPDRATRGWLFITILSMTEAELFQVENLKRRYDFRAEPIDVESVGILDFLHHKNINYLRDELLKHYAFLQGCENQLYQEGINISTLDVY